MKADDVPGQISSLYQYLEPAIDQSGGDFERSISNSVKFQANLLRTSSTVIRDALHADKFRVESGVYDLASGKVMLHGQCWVIEHGMARIALCRLILRARP